MSPKLPRRRQVILDALMRFDPDFQLENGRRQAEPKLTVDFGHYFVGEFLDVPARGCQVCALGSLLCGLSTPKAVRALRHEKGFGGLQEPMNVLAEVFDVTTLHFVEGLFEGQVYGHFRHFDGGEDCPADWTESGMDAKAFVSAYRDELQRARTNYLTGEINERTLDPLYDTQALLFWILGWLYEHGGELNKKSFLTMIGQSPAVQRRLINRMKRRAAKAAQKWITNAG